MESETNEQAYKRGYEDGRRSMYAAAVAKATRHGFLRGNREKKPRFYSVWQNMRTRCTNIKNPRYKRYGGRGISIEWRNFEEFHRDMFDSYTAHVERFGKANTTIERIDRDKNYSKENCRWATLQEQGNNTSRNRFLVHKGEKLTVAQWVDKTGFGRSMIERRLARGLSVSRTLTEPRLTHKRRTVSTK